MKKIIIFFLVAIAITSCHSYNLSEKDFKGVLLSGPNRTQKVVVQVKAKANCNAQIIVTLNDQSIVFPFENSIDSSTTIDWYSNETFVKVNHDECINDTPVIKVKFLNLNGM